MITFFVVTILCMLFCLALAVASYKDGYRFGWADAKAGKEYDDSIH
jgi:hypothetical protein